MSTISAGFSVSLDGFVAEENDDISKLYGWMVGQVQQETPLEDMEYTDEGKDVNETRSTSFGAIVSGRRTFDLAQGWGGQHPLGVPVVIVTHEAPSQWANDGKPFTFVTGGVAQAVARAREIAGEDNVAVCGPDVIRQCLEEGLLDEVGIDLVPLLLGKGVRMFTGESPVQLEKLSADDADGVTHLRYRVVRD
ncbi:DNA-binding protein [Janibacter sp. HTCC2649]|uniref:dihydrofolate reductase family protein n=1 Tax=Janibacter sp. HTCC2649 TaxID=313589 RepID=UPI0000670BD4|nr:dihydrofolate reductase family protein [Janibacter sp. HTCC2649]EAQ00772.1 DNA-binding protein [Janibacter sp. HTCC2649]